MCAIIGFSAPVNQHSTVLLQSLLRQSSYRGLHSMGVAWWNGLHVQVNTGFDPTLSNISSLQTPSGNYEVLAHCRYSTSNIDWPLPLMLSDGAYVMNGVISQDEPANWPLNELEPYTTGNDTEIAHRFASYGMLGQHGGSFAIGRMNFDGSLHFWRNGARPLWWMKARGEALVVASTQDILRRSCLPEYEACEVPEGFLCKLAYMGSKQTVESHFDSGPALQQPSPNPYQFKCFLP